MRHATCGILVLLALLVGWTATAEAGVILVTPTILTGNSSGGKTVTCSLTNFDTRVITVVAQMYDLNATFLTLDGNSCGQLPSGQTCFATKLVATSALCRFESSSNRVKGALQVRDPVAGDTLLVVPAARP
jgi:hypothetical protein